MSPSEILTNQVLSIAERLREITNTPRFRIAIFIISLFT